jgi:hypothetical protein
MLIAKSLGINKKLTVLGLSFNNMSIDSLELINMSLTTLFLRCNNRIASIIDTLSENATLTKLDLRFNIVCLSCINLFVNILENNFRCNKLQNNETDR